MDEYGITNVKYDQKWTKKENLPYSICKCMCDNNIEYLNASWVFSNIDFSLRNYENYEKICIVNGIKDAKERIDEMLIIDFLIGNNDRHLGNYGILRDSNNLKWLSINPVFDNGNSFFHDMNDEDIKYFEINTFSKAFKDKNQNNLEYINYPKWYSNKKSKISEIIEQGLKPNKKLSNKRIDIFEKIIKSLP